MIQNGDETAKAHERGNLFVLKEKQKNIFPSEMTVTVCLLFCVGMQVISLLY